MSTQGRSDATQPGRAKNPVPALSLRFWHGMRLSTWWRELTLNRFDVSPGRWTLRAIVITIVAAVNSLLALLDELVFGARIERTQLTAPPIFVLGHWRSGTTYLHELLACDTAHSCPTTYRCFAPSHFLLSERWLKFPLARLLPRRRPMDDMQVGWDRPQEEEFALANLGVPTPYLSVMFPNRGPRYTSYLTLQTLEPAVQRRWRSQYRRLLKRLTVADNRRLVLKSPPNTARLRTLIEMFPDAKFIHLSRHPSELYTSTLHLWRSLHREQGMQEVVDEDWLAEFVVDSLDRMYHAYFDDLPLLAPGQLIELRYDQLVADPKAALRAAYGTLGLGDFAAVEPSLDTYLATVREYQPNALPPDGAGEAIVKGRWSHYAQAFGYA